ncbi:MAG: LysR family transcriptional regulator [Candidatus Thiodiazotropha sp. LLP2]
MVDFEWYRSFIAVYRSGTVTGAAKARFLTQPAVSQHIAALESAVGSELFQRTPRKMIPTEKCKALYSRVAPAADGLERVTGGLRDTSTVQAPTIRLGTPLDYFHEVGFQRLQQSNFRLQIEFGDAEQMIGRLSLGKLDAVLATQRMQEDNVDYKQIDQENFCLVVSAGTQIPDNFKKAQSSIDEIERFLARQQWISYSAGLPIIRRYWHVAFNRRPDIEPEMIIPSLILIRKAIECGKGISVLPRYICEQSLETGRLTILWQPEEPLTNELWIATRKVDRNKQELQQLVSLLYKTQ